MMNDANKENRVMKIGVKLRDQTSLAQKITQYIKDALLNRELRPGDRLPTENELAQSFGVSRTAVREAFKMLAAIGVAEIRQGDGTYIARDVSSSVIDPLIFSLILEDRTPRELLEVRKMIEVGILEVSINKMTEADIRKMEEAVDELEESYKRDAIDIDVLTNLDLKFHYAFAEATHNPSIIKIARTIWDIFIVSIKKTIPFEKAFYHHRRILEAIKERDLEKAKEAIRVSLEVWEKHQD
jgi:GntR family transcriptional repressor for pyruvate dehydrogenase complex